MGKGLFVNATVSVFKGCVPMKASMWMALDAKAVGKNGPTTIMA